MAKRPNHKQDEIERFLKAFLSGNRARPSAEIRDEAIRQGINEHSFDKHVGKWTGRRQQEGYWERFLLEPVDVKSDHVKSSLWPYPFIHPASLTDDEFIRMLGYVDDPLVARLLDLLEPDNDILHDDYDAGHRQALRDAESAIRAIEKSFESPSSDLTDAFAAILNEIGRLER